MRRGGDWLRRCRDGGNRRDAMRHPNAEALCLQAFLQDGPDIEAKAVREKDAGIALCGDGGRQFVRIDAGGGHQLLEPTRRAIEPWFVKRSDDFRDEGVLAALLEARERLHRRAIASPTLRRIVCRHGLCGSSAERRSWPPSPVGRAVQAPPRRGFRQAAPKPSRAAPCVRCPALATLSQACACGSASAASSSLRSLSSCSSLSPGRREWSARPSRSRGRAWRNTADTP